MGKKKKDESGVAEVVEGTVEHARQQYFDKEKAAYEERTGETVNFELPAPLKSTPLPETVEAVEEESEDAGGSEDESTPPEGDLE